MYYTAMSFTWLMPPNSEDKAAYPGLDLLHAHREILMRVWMDAEVVAGHNDLVILVKEEPPAITVEVGSRVEFLDMLKESGKELEEPYDKIQSPASYDGQTAVWIFLDLAQGGGAFLRFVRTMLSKGGSA